MGPRGLKRGDVVRVASGKPRPAVIVQGDQFVTPIDILLCPFTTTLLDAPIYRVPVPATPHNGLRSDSQLMVDKIGPARRDQIDEVIGQLSAEDMARLTESMAIILGIGR
ncbi:MAG: type II toxin-antitoxin system PemK/MazF family toxin [Sphingomicrobium sp.]